jgi:hypothetical protein
MYVDDDAFDLRGIGELNVDLVHQEHGRGRKVLHQPTQLALWSHRRGGIIGVPEMNHASACLPGFMRHPLDIG